MNAEGIEGIAPADFKFAKRLGYTIKLLSVIRADEQGLVEVRPLEDMFWGDRYGVVVDLCRAYGADQIYTPANDPWGGHHHHVHCSWG